MKNGLGNNLIFIPNKEVLYKELSYLVNLIKKLETLPSKYKEILFWKEIEKKFMKNFKITQLID